MKRAYSGNLARSMTSSSQAVPSRFSFAQRASSRRTERARFHFARCSGVAGGRPSRVGVSTFMLVRHSSHCLPGITARASLTRQDAHSCRVRSPLSTSLHLIHFSRKWIASSSKRSVGKYLIPLTGSALAANSMHSCIDNSDIQLSAPLYRTTYPQMAFPSALRKTSLLLFSKQATAFAGIGASPIPLANFSFFRQTAAVEAVVIVILLSFGCGAPIRLM